MPSFSPRDNFYKLVVLLLACLAIAFGFFSTVSCRWFELTDPQIATSHWDFLPASAAVDTRTSMKVGLYQYEESSSANLGVCSPYSRALLGRGPNALYSWMFTSQICVVLGPIVASLAVAILLFGGAGENNRTCCGCFALFAETPRQQRWLASCLILIAAGLQWASVIASISWVGNFWDSDWLVGANLNVLSSVLLSLSWVFANCGLHNGLILESPDDDDDDVKDGSSVETNSLPEMSSTDEDRSSNNANDEEMEDVELGSPPQPALRKKHSLLARELLGTNDPIIFNAVAQSAMAIREFAENKKTKPETDDNDDKVDETDIEQNAVEGEVKKPGFEPATDL